MSKLRDRLSKFEAQLQALIEGGTTRIISGGETQDQIGTRLIEAMQRSVTHDQEGRAIAADTYILVVGSENAQILSEDLEITGPCSKSWLKMGGNRGLYFKHHPG